MKRQTSFVFLTCFFISALFLTICSKSSFLYPINDWGDANAYVTVAKMMMNGRVLYSEIFEQKGLYLYLLHILTNLISYPSFFGVYVIETLSFAGFLFFTYKTLMLYVPGRLILPTLPILAFIVLTSSAFSHGDSAEELLLPLLAYSFFVMLRWTKIPQCGTKHDTRIWILQGVMTAVIFWTKYTVLGFHIGFCIAAAIICLSERDFRKLLFIAGYWLAGIVIGSLPAIAYFGITNSFPDMYEVYIKSNMFNYGKMGTNQFSLVPMQSRILSSIKWNLFIFLFAAVGLLGTTFTQGKKEIRTKIAVWCVFIGVFSFAHFLPVYYTYYALPIAVLSVTGLLFVLRIIDQRRFVIKRRRTTLMIMTSILLALLPVSFVTSSNTYLISYKKAELPQYQFKDIIMQNKHATLLTHYNLDLGFQNLCEIIPDYKFFIATNTAIPERIQEWRVMVEKGQIDYVISKNELLELKYPSFPYELIASSSYNFEKRIQVFLLYRLIRQNP